MSGLQPARIGELRREASVCRACDLWKPATQTVFGEGPERPELVFVGEQPGDQEDRAGPPFVGPAGQMFDRALGEAGIDRSRAYVTNAVKHFKFEPRGKLRLHRKPNAGEIKVCRSWLIAELDALQSHFVVALGATAAQSLLGRATPVLANRGRMIESPEGWRVFVTFHPSSLLRAPDEAAKAQAFTDFVRDLKALRALAADGAPVARPASLFG